MNPSSAPFPAPLTPPPPPGRRPPPFKSPAREYAEVLGVIALVTVGASFSRLGHEAIGHIYLLAVITLCLRVGRGPVLFAALLSALVWNYFFIPPRFSLQLVDFDNAILLGVYFAVAIIAGQMIARIRAQEQYERQQQRQATALYHLARALTAGRARDEALRDALLQAEALFEAPTVLLLPGADGGFEVHPAGPWAMGGAEQAAATWVKTHGRPAGRFTAMYPEASSRFVPLRRAEATFGVLVLNLPPDANPPAPEQEVLLETFAAQIALLLEREELRAAAEREKLLTESDRLHRTLFDSVSHELKTPLAVLRAAGDQLGRADADKRAALVGEIQTATRRLDRLVANLLSQSRLTSGYLRATADWCDVRDIIQAARRAVGDSLAGRPVRVEVPADMPLLLADPLLLEQVLVNLLLNANHHTPPGSPVQIATGLEDREGRPWIFVRVTDHGSGIPDELRANLFQKFSRAPGARPGGLGLGLAIVRGFMRAQGGDVTAENTKAGGACFSLFLPHNIHGNVPDDET